MAIHWEVGKVGFGFRLNWPPCKLMFLFLIAPCSFLGLLGMNSVTDGNSGSSSRKGRFKIIGKTSKGGAVAGKEMTSNPKVSVGLLDAQQWVIHYLILRASPFQDHFSV